MSAIASDKEVVYASLSVPNAFSHVRLHFNDLNILRMFLNKIYTFCDIQVPGKYCDLFYNSHENIFFSPLMLLLRVPESTCNRF